MNKLPKLLASLLIFFSVILVVSPTIDKSDHNDNIIKLNQVGPSHKLSGAKIPNKRIIMEPVVKLTRITFEEPGIISIDGSATGFSIKYDYKDKVTYIMTNHHFCENNTDKEIGYLYTKSDDTSGGDLVDPDRTLEFVSSSEKRDLCILKADEKIAPVKFADYRDQLDQLEKIYIVGAPKGIFPIVLETYFTSYIQRGSLFSDTMGEFGHDYLLISDLVYGGHSGSPIFNHKGELIGVVFARYQGGYGGFGIGLPDVVEFIGESNI